MAKVKVKKQSTFIDMTAMSDVTVLLLTFFMLTSTFLAKEPVQVVTPASVSEIKIPETNKLTMLIDKDGKLFMSMDNVNDMEETLRRVGADYGITFTPAELNKFKQLPSFGVPIAEMKNYLEMSGDQQNEFVKEYMTTDRVGIPTKGRETVDPETGKVTKDNEFRHWIQQATAVNPDLLLAIKSDQTTPYPVVQDVMDNLRDLRKNRYLLITSLKTASND